MATAPPPRELGKFLITVTVAGIAGWIGFKWQDRLIEQYRIDRQQKIKQLIDQEEQQQQSQLQQQQSQSDDDISMNNE